jgi:hypothetical protein
MAAPAAPGVQEPGFKRVCYCASNYLHALRQWDAHRNSDSVTGPAVSGRIIPKAANQVTAGTWCVEKKLDSRKFFFFSATFQRHKRSPAFWP